MQRDANDQRHFSLTPKIRLFSTSQEIDLVTHPCVTQESCEGSEKIEFIKYIEGVLLGFLRRASGMIQIVDISHTDAEQMTTIGKVVFDAKCLRIFQPNLMHGPILLVDIQLTDASLV